MALRHPLLILSVLTFIAGIVTGAFGLHVMPFAF